jgi:hypothetical protein
MLQCSRSAYADATAARITPVRPAIPIAPEMGELKSIRPEILEAMMSLLRESQ